MVWSTQRFVANGENKDALAKKWACEGPHKPMTGDTLYLTTSKIKGFRTWPNSYYPLTEEEKELGIEPVNVSTPIFTMSKEGIRQLHQKSDYGVVLLEETNYKNNTPHGFSKKYNPRTGKINHMSFTNQVTGEHKDHTFELKIIQLVDFFTEGMKAACFMKTRTTEELNRDQAKKVSCNKFKKHVKKYLA